MNPILQALKSIGTFPGTLFTFLEHVESRLKAIEDWIAEQKAEAAAAEAAAAQVAAAKEAAAAPAKAPAK